jgi:hypothetical protein
LGFPQVTGFADAAVLSLNIGTLTNVGYAFPSTKISMYMNFVFIQVFTTMSLIILSLASYLSRKE